MAIIDDLIEQIQDINLRTLIEAEIAKISKQKKFGLVFENHMPECTPLFDVPIRIGKKVAKKDKKITDIYIVQAIEAEETTCINVVTKEIETLSVSDLVCVAEFGEAIYPYLKPIDSIENASDSNLWHILIESDNYHALQLLEYIYGSKVDCIYIDPPYNTGAKDWKYNNDYVDSSDAYRHSKWLSMMEKRLKLAKKLLNPSDSVLIVTIDEKEYLHLGCLLEDIFPEAKIQMITDVINPRGTNRLGEFSRVEEYIYICRFGDAVITKTDNNMLGNTDETGKSRVWYSFNRGNNPRASANNQFYPIYIDPASKKIVKVGEPLPLGTPPESFPKLDGAVSVFPINDKGQESIWRSVPETTRKWVDKGYVKVSKFYKKSNRWTLSYISSGLQNRIETGEIVVDGYDETGALKIDKINTANEKVNPRSVWVQKYHNATDYGSSIIKELIPNHSFTYPKSLYSVKDTVNFFVASKPNAIILDFFAGSGTTLHAVNLLNSEDGGKRKCIMVTNNEVSESEEKKLKKSGYSPNDKEWEKQGIAHHVTWPRTVCSILGKNIKGEPLKGNYKGSNQNMSDGFKSNAAFFKLGFLDKDAVALGRQFQDLLPILWMKAGSFGKCPNLAEEEIPKFLVFHKNKFAVLIDEKYFNPFLEEVNKLTEIKTIYLVTDSDNGYREMSAQLNRKTSYQLYRDYLDNFRINTGR